MSDVLTGSAQPADSVAGLLASARQGSVDDLGRALEACRLYLLMVANKNFPAALRPEEGPSDLVQKTITQGMMNFEKFGGTTEAQLQAWLKRILLNLLANARDRIRRRPARQSLDCAGVPEPDTGAAKSPLEDLIRRADHARLKAALAELSEEDQQVLHLRQWQRLRFPAIAALMGKPSADAARKFWARAVGRLIKLLGPGDAQQ